MPESDYLQNLLSRPSKEKWEKIGIKKRSGVLIPLFSVYSGNSLGIGDFSDLKLVIDWARLTGNSIIQLLPLNELGGLNCPYDAISSFALEPAYICLNDIAGFDKRQVKFSPANDDFVDYRVKEEKLRLLWGIFLPLDLSEAEDFEQFQKDNTYWLLDFALFKALKDFYQGKPWYEWEPEFKTRETNALERFFKEHIEAVTFQMWLQWVAFKQFSLAKAYALKNNVLLKGDLPILVSRDSADAWRHPEFFKLDTASGAPPDMYCAKGQRWGMPTYNWDRISGDNYRYLKEKLRYAQNFYDILRVDHVVGLFRIWSIPYSEALDHQGLNGVFDPADERIWGEHGRKIISVLVNNTKMLLCAEDLGVIPQVCRDTLLEFGVPGNDVQRWVKDWGRRHDFLKPQEYRELSVATLSTHDTTTWKAWWQYEAGTVDEALFIRKCAGRVDYVKIKDKLFSANLSRHGRLRWLDSIDSVDKLTQELSSQGGAPKEHLRDFIELYQNSYQEKEKLWKLLGCPGQPEEEADPELLSRIIKFTLDSCAVFCIQSINDWLGLNNILKGDPYLYRINVPGTINPRNWSLRLPLTLEELLRHPINQRIRKMVVDSGRS